MLKYPSIKVGKRGEANESIDTTESSQDAFSKAKSGIIKYIFGNKVIKERTKHLGIADFLSVAVSWEASMVNIIFIEEYDLLWGGHLFYLVYFIIGLIITMPIKLALLFMGTYTRRGYFVFWEMCPIFKGTIWSVSLFSILLELLNITYGGLALTYAYDVLHSKIPWIDCKFDGASESCYSMYPKKKYFVECCQNMSICTYPQNGMLSFSTFDYFLSKLQFSPDNGKYDSGLGTLITPWVYGVAVTWMSILISLNSGFGGMSYLLSKMASFIIIAIFLPIILLTVIMGSLYPDPSSTSSDITRIMIPEFWYFTIVHSLIRIAPGNFIYLGSTTPSTIKPTTIVILMFGAKCVLHYVVESWQNLCQHLIAEHYKIANYDCIPQISHSSFFVTIPDILTRLPFAQFWLFMWFFGLWYFSLCTAVYTMTAFLESMMEAMPIIKNVKIYFSTMLVTICFLLNLIFLRTNYLLIFDGMKTSVIPFATYLLFSIFIIALSMYSIRRLQDDYYFTYGDPMDTYWVYTLKYSPILVIFVLVVYHSSSENYHKYYESGNIAITVLCYSANILLCLPIIITSVWIYLRYKNEGKPKLSITASNNWGPPTEEEKYLRTKFKPEREFRFTSWRQKCDHCCLLNSEELKKRMRIQDDELSS